MWRAWGPRREGRLSSLGGCAHVAADRALTLPLPGYLGRLLWFLV